jgi:manganese/iron transport system substrate-binding protein
MLKGISKSILSIAILGLTACSINKRDNLVRAQEQKPSIVASHSIICDFVTTIIEDTIDLTCLIDPNQTPHTYRPTPSDRKALETAGLILYGGYQLEPSIINILEANKDNQTSVPKVAVYENAVAKPILSKHEHAEEGHAEHSEEEHAEHQGEAESASDSETEQLEPDPHVWHNVENAVATVELIQPLLIQLNPINAGLYLKNSVALTEKLWQLDSWIKEQIATIPERQRVLVTTHNSLNYYVRAYQFKDYKSLEGLSPDDSPTASQLRELAIEIEQLQIPTIFAESTASDRVIANVAREADVQLASQRLYVDGLGESGNYIDMMVGNTCAIVNGLEGNCRPFE